MLVLSRRESEKVLFPSLGITVEVSRIKGNTVRLGIDAPREFRVIRAELDDDREHAFVDPGQPVDTSGPNSSGFSYGKPACSPAVRREKEVQRNLDAVSLTVQLAQNQLRQGLGSHAEEALEQAMDSLRELERTLLLQSSSIPAGRTVVVRESPSAYGFDKGALDVNSENEVNAGPFAERRQEVRQLVDLLGQQFSDWSAATGA